MADQPSSSSSSSDHTSDGVAEAVGLQDAAAQKEEALHEPVLSKSEDPSLSGTGIDQLLQRHRNELMYELRNLRHGQRPVTGQDNRRNVEDFFNQALQEGPSDTPPQTHRPEAVLVEVNALVERRPVSSALGRSGFISRLESTLEGARSRISVRAPAPPRPRNTEAVSLSRPSPLPAPRRSLRQSVTTSERPEEATGHSRDSLPLPVATQESRARVWLEQHEMPLPAPSQPEQGIPIPTNMWESLEESQRDNLVMDISELLQQQLVTSTLESPNTRNRLENIVTNRLVQTGTNGPQVQQYIQALPRSFPHQRNDFSHLGLGAHDSTSDDISVISATAAVTVHNAQSNAMSREMKALKSQINELKNMMRMSFDMQLDIQRAIRQEVAAAVSGALSANQSTAMQSAPIQEGHCLICLDKSVDAVLYQCGHMCVCYTCGQRLKSHGNNCPVCRAPIRDIIRSYKCSLE